MANLGSLVVNIGAKTDGLQAGLQRADSLVGGFGKGLGKLGGAAVLTGVGAVATGVGAIGAAAVVGTGKVLSMGDEINTMQDNMIAQLGATTDEAERFGDVATAVFRNNFTDSLTDAGDLIIQTRQQLGDLTDNELQNAAEDAARLSDSFGVDYAESLNAAKVLTDEFGITTDQAFDLMAKGFQDGLNSSDDFLDSIREYGNLFAEGGASAEEFYSLLETGLAGGVLGTDKAADVFKEFQIRLLEGNEDLLGAMDHLGAPVDDIMAGLSDGSLTAIEVFDLLTGHIAQIEDPLERNNLGVALMGSMFEDLGESAVLGIDTAKTSMEDLEGATDSLNAKYNNFGAMFEGLKRKALVAFAPIGEKVMDLAESIMPHIEAAFDRLMPYLDQAAAWLGVNIPLAIETLSPYVEDLRVVFAEFAQNLLPVLIEGWATLQETFTTQIQPALAEVGAAIAELTGESTSWEGILSILRTTLSVIGPIITGIVAVLKVWWTVISYGLQNLAALIRAVRLVYDGITSLVSGVKDAVTWARELFSLDWGSIGDKLPDWLIPGSPTPFEIGLRGIGEAIAAMPQLDVGLNANTQAPSLAGAVAGGGGFGDVNITIPGAQDPAATAQLVRREIEQLWQQARA